MQVAGRIPCPRRSGKLGRYVSVETYESILLPLVHISYLHRQIELIKGGATDYRL